MCHKVNYIHAGYLIVSIYHEALIMKHVIYS